MPSPPLPRTRTRQGLDRPELHWQQLQGLLRPQLRRIAEGFAGRTRKQQDAVLTFSVPLRSARPKSTRHRALGTRHGVRWSTPPLLGWTRPFIILLSPPAICYQKVPSEAFLNPGNSGALRFRGYVRVW